MVMMMVMMMVMAVVMVMVGGRQTKTGDKLYCFIFLSSLSRKTVLADDIIYTYARRNAHAHTHARTHTHARMH